jgi:glutamine cyclotransferase
MMGRRFALFFLVLIAAVSCDQSDSGQVEKTPSLLSPKPTLRVKLLNQGTIYYGDTLRLEVESKDQSQSFSSVEISLADGKSVLASSASGKFTLPTKVTGGGMLKVKFDARFEDGQKGVRYKDITVLAREQPQQWSLRVQRKFPHDPTSFTQGFLVHNGFLYEGTGNYKESRIRKIELATGKVLKERGMDDDIFGEGITIFNNKIYQITYKTSRGFVYDLESFDLVDEFTYNTYTSEGWGLTHNDTALIASDGSANLYFFDPNTLTEIGRMRVFNHRGEVTRLNELEYHNGIIYANIYTAAEIVAIDATTGQVLHEYTARGMIDKSEITSDMDVLNGIAINPLNGNMLITGKYWSKVYEVTPVPRADS